MTVCEFKSRISQSQSLEGRHGAYFWHYRDRRYEDRSQNSSLVQAKRTISARFEQELEFVVSIRHLTVSLSADTLSRGCIRLTRADVAGVCWNELTHWTLDFVETENPSSMPPTPSDTHHTLDPFQPRFLTSSCLATSNPSCWLE